MKIELHGSIPMTTTAVKIGGDGCAKITFEIPTSDLEKLLEVVETCREKPLKITVEPDI